MVIANFKAVFARHGIPAELIADHVPFTTGEMAQYVKACLHPFPQSNGMAKRTIQMIQ